MFTLEEYRLLNESLQAQLLWIDGIFLMARKTEKLKAELFSLYGFYVEVFFEDNNEPLFIRPFTEMNLLEGYLPLINIDDVFEKIDGNNL